METVASTEIAPVASSFSRYRFSQRIRRIGNTETIWNADPSISHNKFDAVRFIESGCFHIPCYFRFGMVKNVIHNFV